MARADSSGSRCLQKTVHSSGFSPAERRFFTEFTMGTPKMPPGGLRTKQLTVCMERLNGDSFRARTQAEMDRKLPVTSTCFFRITLPQYSSREVLAERLRYAMSEGLKFFENTRKSLVPI